MSAEPLQPWPLRKRIAQRATRARRSIVGHVRARLAVARWIVEPPPLIGRRVCLLASYSRDGKVASLTRDLCAAWCANGFDVVLVIATEHPSSLAPSAVEGTCAVLVRSNVGYDFGSWTTALRMAPSLMDAALLVITNDSMFGPLTGFDRLLERVDASTADIVGLTDSHQARHHLQSYCVFYRPRALCSEVFDRFWHRPRFHDRDETIQSCELPMLATFRDAGFAVDVLFPAPTDFDGNPTLERWRQLLDEGLPFVKVQLLRDNPFATSIAGWDAALRERGYDPARVASHFGRDFAYTAAAPAMGRIAGGKPARIGVVIVNWNGWRMTLDGIAALRATRGDAGTWHAYVVDNASTDGSLDHLEGLGEDITLIRSPVNGGWTGGNNLGVERALAGGHEFVFLLNNDAMLHPDALIRLMATHEARAAERPILGCLQRTDDGSGYTFVSIGIDPATGLLADLDPQIKQGLLALDCIPTPVVNGAALFTHRSTFEEVGRFDDRFYLNFDESDWCLRAAAAGHARYTVRDAVVFHSGNKSIGGAESPLQTYFVFRNHLLFSEKHGTWPQRLRVLRRCVSRLRDLTGRHGPIDFMRQMMSPSPVLAATQAGLRDYLLRRFGDCPPAIRALNRAPAR